MNKKGNIGSLIRNGRVAFITMIVLTLSMVTGCGENKNTAPTPPTTTVTKEDTTPEVVESTESTPVETVEPTETVLETDEVIQPPQTPEEWAKSIDTEDFLVAIWNDSTKEAIIVEDGQKYSSKDVSSIIVKHPSEYSPMVNDICDTFSAYAEDYVIFDINDKTKQSQYCYASVELVLADEDKNITETDNIIEFYFTNE